MKCKRTVLVKHCKQYWKLYLKYLSAACLVSFVSMFFLTMSEDMVEWFRSLHTKVDIKRLAKDYKEDTNIYENNTVVNEMFKKVRVLCLVITTKGKLDSSVAVINATWGQRCNKILYVMCIDKEQDDILNSCQVTESKSHLVAKVRYVFRHVYQYYVNQYDWFLKADDDTFVIMENLRFLLSHHNPDLPGYLGYHFKLYVKQGYMSGGAGYVISQKGVKKLFEEGFKENACDADGYDEDLEIGKCLQMSGVPPLVSYDKFGRETFHTDKFWQHVYGTYPKYLKKYAWNDVRDGTGCCSQFSVTFHHVNPQTMLFLHHILYRTSVYGKIIPTDINNMFSQAKVLPLDK